MSTVCLYFQVHQPRRLRRYSVFDTGADYFDDAANAAILQKVAQRCYLPATSLLLSLVEQHGDAFRFALSLSGTLLESLERFMPAALNGFRELAQTGAVEILGETYYHSLATLYSSKEFAAQVELHRAACEKYLGVTPRVFRNTELILDNTVVQLAQAAGFSAVLGEGWQNVVGRKGPGYLYTAAAAPIRLLLRNFTLSDDVAFRFTRRDWAEWPLTAMKFAQRIATLNDGPLCNLFMDYETFGEHQDAATGIMQFLGGLPEALMAEGHTFQTPSELVAAGQPTGTGAIRGGKRKNGGAADPPSLDGGVVDIPRTISWADEARDLSAWMGNAMQTQAAQELYKMESAVKKRHDDTLLADWRNLTTSDHLYYMSTKHLADGQVHGYFSPYESPYDAYINFMNVLDNLRMRTGAKGVRV